MKVYGSSGILAVLTLARTPGGSEPASGRILLPLALILRAIWLCSSCLLNTYDLLSAGEESFLSILLSHVALPGLEQYQSVERMVRLPLLGRKALSSAGPLCTHIQAVDRTPPKLWNLPSSPRSSSPSRSYFVCTKGQQNLPVGY